MVLIYSGLRSVHTMTAHVVNNNELVALEILESKAHLTYSMV